MTDTVLTLLERNHLVRRGFVCTSANDIQCVDGLCNIPGKYYWSIQVNGDFKDYNSMTPIKPTDRVDLKYLPVSSYIEK